MPAYHSTFLSENPSEQRIIGNVCLLPIHTKFRGPAYPPQQDYDIAEETLDLFRANSFFRNFEIKGPADRLLIYGILYVSDCLSKLSRGVSLRDAQRLLSSLAVDNFSLPGEIGFPLNLLYLPPANKSEAELLRQYLLQFRQEVSDRLLKKVYADSDEPSKFWLSFTKRRFMNKHL